MQFEVFFIFRGRIAVNGDTNGLICPTAGVGQRGTRDRFENRRAL
mgnify:FL=1